jgi:hypothetical protein
MGLNAVLYCTVLSSKYTLNNHADAKEQFLILYNLPSYILNVLPCASDHTKASKNQNSHWPLSEISDTSFQDLWFSQH